MKRKVYDKQMNRTKTTKSTHENLGSLLDTLDVSPDIRSVVTESTHDQYSSPIQTHIPSPLTILPNVGDIFKTQLRRQTSNYVNKCRSVSGDIKVTNNSLDESEDVHQNGTQKAILDITAATSEYNVIEKSIHEEYLQYDEPPSYTALSPHPAVTHRTGIQFQTSDYGINPASMPGSLDSLTPLSHPYGENSKADIPVFGSQRHDQNSTVSYNFLSDHQEGFRRHDVKQNGSSDDVSSILSVDLYSCQDNTRMWVNEHSGYVNNSWDSNINHMHNSSITNTMFTNDMNSQQYTSSLDDSPDNSSNLNDSSFYKGSPDPSRRKRKRVQNPSQRSAANSRERKRMCGLNVAFDTLKDHLPNLKDNKKLSRIQTLKEAICYINLLRDALHKS